MLNSTNFDEQPENGMSTAETCFLVSAALLALFLIGGMMVSTPEDSPMPFDRPGLLHSLLTFH